MDDLSDAAFGDQLLRADWSIRLALDDRSHTTSCLLPPGGGGARTAARAFALGKQVVSWDVDPRDWARPGAEAIARAVTSRARPGAVVLLHDAGGREQTIAALGMFLPRLIGQGYRFALLCEAGSRSTVRAPIASGEGAAIPAQPHSPTSPARFSTEGAPLIYLTFDDGPDERWTPLTLDLLAKHNAQATFFVVGSMALEHSEVLRRMVAEGHNVSNHTLDHGRLDTLDDAEFLRQIVAGEQAIQQVLGSDYEVPCLRPPYGAKSGDTAERIEALGKHVVMWSINPRDWRQPGAEVIAEVVLEQAYPGAVVLLHEGIGRFQTYEALDVILSELGEIGYRFAALCGH